MPLTGSSRTNLFDNRVIAQVDIKDRLLDFLEGAVKRHIKALLTGTSGASDVGRWLDAVTVTDGGGLHDLTFSALRGSDGTGLLISVDLADADITDVPFEDAGAVTYHMGVRVAEIPTGISSNVQTGQIEYDYNLLRIGYRAEPTAVADDGDGTLTATIGNHLFHASDDLAGRTAIIFLKDPESLNAAVAIETVTITTPDQVATVGGLGQTVISTTASDYEVVVVGPIITRDDISPDVESAYIGTVVGGAAPRTFDFEDQARNYSLLEQYERLIYLEGVHVLRLNGAGVMLPFATPRIHWIHDPTAPGIVIDPCGTFPYTNNAIVHLAVCCGDDAHLAAGRPEVLYGFAEGTTPSFVVHRIRLAENGGVSSAVVSTGTAIADAKVALLREFGTQKVWAFYHTGTSLKCKASTDGGTTWGGEVTAWDPATMDPLDAFTLVGSEGGAVYPLILHTGDDAGRIFLFANYDDNSAGQTHIRYVYSDDDCATWQTNGGFGWPVMASATAMVQPVAWQDRDGTIWTIARAAGGTDAVHFVMSTGDDLPDPADVTAHASVYTGGTVEFTPFGVVVDPSGGVLVTGKDRGSDYLTFMTLVPSGTALHMHGYLEMGSAGSGLELLGASCVGPDGGLYVAYGDSNPAPDEGYLFAFDLGRQFVPSSDWYGGV